MAIHISGTEAYLDGDWTISGVTRNLESLSLSLQQIQHGSEKKLRIDCGQMKETDISGLQLLNVWMQCARFRGVEPSLVNVPERLQHVMQVLVEPCVYDTCPDAAMLAG